MLHAADTIVAISSAVGPAPRMIVRISGSAAFDIVATTIGAPAPPLDRRAGVSLQQLRIGALEFPAQLYCFVTPRSATGEDTIELHISGNPLLARLLVDALVAAGARRADAGEFTARAYFNGKVDLMQAEGIAASIAASSAAEARAARQLLAGELAAQLRPALNSLADALALVEVGIDFSEEDVSFLSSEKLLQRVNAIDAQLSQLQSGGRRGEANGGLLTIALAGWPNAGKSTLLNTLCGRDRAIVSAVAGTTRDAIRAEIRLSSGIAQLTDAAGIESDPPPAGDVSAGASVRREMQRRALAAAATSDVLVLVQEFSDTRPPPDLPRLADIVVLSKFDLAPAAAAGSSEGPAAPLPRAAPSPILVESLPAGDRTPATIAVSAHSGTGVDRLREILDQYAFARAGGERLALNDRHLAGIAHARAALMRAIAPASAGMAELVALELREALDQLGQVLGHVTPDDVLGRVFSSFCIGK